ncbi:carboxypeptidase-like regulatory domain-containing protein [Mucilaginibacter sp. UYCu711]|uniref:carboxypeptidase-like regulatory domain-containing protein n=1 Tax=Mucilaginibacter sp. UYCu711 TaxID=3156339 RepID=UPI003D201DA8
MKLFFCPLACMLLSLNLWAQQGFSITGIIKDENGTPLQSVTVFIDGSNKYTMTDVSGHYSFTSIEAGTYRIATSMVGRGSERVIVNIRNKPVTTDFVMKVKPTELNEVVIGTDSRRNEMLRVFTNKFIGMTENAKSCTIINPKNIEFTTNKNILLATTPDFLIIENKNLGYRIKYLVKIFRYDRSKNITSYTGDCIFEELPGSTRQKKEWVKNRQLAYAGSFMHFLRSLYADNTREQGFKCYAFIEGSKTPTISDELVDMSQYVTRIDSNFIRLAFKKQFQVAHSSNKVILIKHGPALSKLLADTSKQSAWAKPNTNSNAIVLNADQPLTDELRKKLIAANMSSLTPRKDAGVVKMYLDFTVVDRNGNYLDYRSFLLEGLWNELQVGDRLPFTYQP